MDHAKLEDEAPKGWFSRYDMEIFIPEVQKLRPLDLYVELGVNRGRSLWCARKFSDPNVMVWGVDTGEDPQIEGTVFFRGDSADSEVEIVSSVNLIFIDADHGYDFVKRDIEAWYPKMAKGGVMLFHDYDQTSPGVIRAVDEFLLAHNWLRLEVFGDRTSIAKVQL